MPNGITWTYDELNKYAEPIHAIENVLTEFANRYGKKVDHSSYHGYLSRSISFQEPSTTGPHDLVKTIYLVLKEKTWPPTYHLYVTVHTAHGIKDLLRLIPFVGNWFIPKNRMRWETTIQTFPQKIDPLSLAEALKQARNELESFNESVNR